MSMWSEIGEHISETAGSRFIVRRSRCVGGGCINAAYIVEDNNKRFFVKLNNASKLAMFEAESAGLNEIANSGTLRTPTPLCWGITGNSSYLVLEYLDMGPGGDQSVIRFAQQLADMHRVTTDHYGWDIDNTIGATAQINRTTRSWLDFWRECRVSYQLDLAARNGHHGMLQAKGERLLEGLPVLLDQHQPAPSLLHGDLWSGNYAFDRQGQAIIFDPAVYYGDRETDLAMTELFGGFPASFYHAYQEAFPLDEGYPARKILYNLYHVLNHLNLFGGSYLNQALGMMDVLLCEVRRA